jgi:hypothetical protein
METSSVVKYLEAYPMNAFSGYLYCSDLMDIKAQPWLVTFPLKIPKGGSGELAGPGASDLGRALGVCFAVRSDRRKEN